MFGARETGDSVRGPALSPALRALTLFSFVILGLAPQALCCRSLRELCSRSLRDLIVTRFATLLSPASRASLPCLSAWCLSGIV